MKLNFKGGLSKTLTIVWPTDTSGVDWPSEVSADYIDRLDIALYSSCANETGVLILLTPSLPWLLPFCASRIHLMGLVLLCGDLLKT